MRIPNRISTAIAAALVAGILASGTAAAEIVIKFSRNYSGGVE